MAKFLRNLDVAGIWFLVYGALSLVLAIVSVYFFLNPVTNDVDPLILSLGPAAFLSFLYPLISYVLETRSKNKKK